MGWTCIQGRRNDVVDNYIRDHGDDKRGFFVLKRKWDGWSKLWLLCETRRPGEEPDEATHVQRFIMVLLVQSVPSRGEWCLKEVSDDMGPAEVSAPLSWLDEVTIDRKDGYAYPWYQKVREYHRRRGAGKKLAVSTPVKLTNGWDAVITSVAPLRCSVQGMPYRLKRSQIDWIASGIVSA